MVIEYAERCYNKQRTASVAYELGNAGAKALAAFRKASQAGGKDKDRGHTL